MKFLISLGLLSVLLCISSAHVMTKRVVYMSGGQKMEGFMAWDSHAKGPRPGVMIVHDWNGLDTYEEGRAKMLAELGYVAFACDIYGQGVHPKTPAENGQLAGKYKGDRNLFRQRLTDGLAALTSNKDVDKKHVAAIGYCFGGTGVIELARTGAKLAGVVSFHGGIDTPTPADTAKIKCPIAICHGNDDPFVPAADITKFQATMAQYKKPYEWHGYPGAVHAFTVPEAGNDNSKGAAYNKAADTQSWKDMMAFFKRVLGR